jgi:hypothetical protein
MADYLQHVSVQRYHLQVIQITKIATQKYWLMGGLYLYKISFVQSVYTQHNYPLIKTQNQVSLLSKGKAVPLQAWSAPEGSRKLRFPDYITTAQDGGKLVSLTHRPPLPPGNAPGTHFC